MLLKAPEMDVEFVERGEQGAERRARRQLREGVHVLREALAAVTALAVRPRNVGVRVVDVARQQAARVDLRPVRAHLLAVLLHGVEVRHLVRAEDVVRILCDLRLKGGHHREPLAGEDPRQERQRRRVALDGEDHRLPPEILDVRTLRQELRHVEDAMPRLPREPRRGARQDRRAHEDGHIRQPLDEFLHERQILRPVVLRRHMDLQERDIDCRKVVIVSLRRIRDVHLAILRVVLLNPGLERPAHKPAPDYSDFDFFTHLNLLPPMFVSIDSHSEKPCFSVEFVDTYSIHSFPPPSRRTQQIQGFQRSGAGVCPTVRGHKSLLLEHISRH